MSNIDEDSICVFIPAWGDLHLGYLKRFALPSVLQPGNLPACGYSKIIVRGASVGPIEPLMRVLSEGFQGIPGVEFLVHDYGDHENALLQGFRDTIRFCIERKCRMLLAMPDTIFANGGIFNMRQYARGKPVSVAAAHLRVNANTATTGSEAGFLTSPVGAQELVGIAMRNAHQSQTESYAENDNGTLTGGISLTRISDRLRTCIHFLPTTYLAWFTESDAAFFNGVKFFGSIDHDWPRHLYNEGRFRVFGSSDLFFAVELTDPAANRIKVEPASRLEEDSTAGPDFMKCFVGALHG